MQNNHTDQIKLDGITATGRVDERSGIDLIEDFPFMPRLSKHSELFSAAAKHIVEILTRSDDLEVQSNGN
jgi:hypothetical protein